jgi:hypothetical protein
MDGKRLAEIERGVAQDEIDGSFAAPWQVITVKDLAGCLREAVGLLLLTYMMGDRCDGQVEAFLARFPEVGK